jgi:EAL domain-containing protein (putative c-di-GMP-specific phosphodiesterase class I)/ActR/RegA family two-component response regulator
MSREARAPARGRVLVAEDDPASAAALSHVLRARGLSVDTARTAQAVAAAIDRQRYDAVVTDVSVGVLDGIALLRIVHAIDAEVPVILITALPDMDTAIQGVEYGAFRYLVKPVSGERLEAVVLGAIDARRAAQSRLRRRRDSGEIPSARSELLVQRAFERMLETLWIAYQPVVESNGEVFGHEAFLRSREPALATPEAVLTAAARLGALELLGRVVRRRVAESFVASGARGVLFINIHPCELEDDTLGSPACPLAPVADRVVFDLTERGTPPGTMVELRSRIARLREHGYRIALDDLGAGFAELTNFVFVEPDIVKIDPTLVRGVDTSPLKRRLIHSVAKLCHETGICVLAEGVETAAERDALLEIGCDLFQGHFIAAPGPAFPPASWDRLD